LPTVAELAQQELDKRRVQQVSAFQSSYNPFNPNFRATVGSKLRELIDDSGIGGGYRQGLINAGEGVETGIDFTPIVGDAVGIGDIRTSYNQGDMLGTGINTLAAAVGALPIIGDSAAKGVKFVGSALRNVIPAGHASPHRFEQFSMDKIGTGEGAQVYGHGLYFAENPTVVDEYFNQFNSPVLRFKEKNVDTPYTAELRDRFKNVYEGLIDYKGARDWKENVLDLADEKGLDVDEVDDKLNVLFKNVFEGTETPRDFAAIDEYGLGIDLNEIYDLAGNQTKLDNILGGISQAKTMNELEYVVEGFSPDEKQLYTTLVKPELQEISDAASRYDVNLNVSPEELLDWDAPYSKQPEKVKKVLDDILTLNGVESYISKDTGSKVYLGVADSADLRGSDIYRIITDQMGRSPASASQELSASGVKGIKYFDGMSRNRGEGTSNYVIFDDSLIDTKRVNDQLTPSWMNPEARMQRAQDLGFDTSRVSYRGLSGEYDPNKAGNYQMFTSSPEDAGEYGSYVVPAYLNKGNNLVVEGGRNNFNSIPVSNLPAEVKANLHSSVGDVARTDDIAYAAQLAGYDSVTINNVFDKASNEIPLKPLPASNEPMSQEMIDILDEVNASGMLENTPDVALPPSIPKDYEPATIDIIFDPKNIRSTNAEFDPTKADSADLLSSGGTTSALRGIA